MAKAPPPVTEPLRLEYLPLSGLKSAVRNPKKHRTADIQTSIGRFGYVEPIVIDERTERLVAGHGRRESLDAMRSTGAAPPQGIREVGTEWFVPVLRGWSSRSDIEAEAEAYLLASNRLTEAGGWDNGPLVDILKQLHEAKALDGVGYDAKELGKLLDSVGGSSGTVDPDEVPELVGPPRVKQGELWVLGDHRILCGDATKLEDLARLMGDAFADICWTDPPWNVDYGASKNPAGWSDRSDRAIANDNLGDAFPGFCTAFCASIAIATKPGAPVYMAMSAQEWPVIDAALRAAGFHWSSTIIWAKDSLVLSRKDYHTQYEPLWYGWNDKAARLCPLEDRKQSDLWSIDRPKKSEEHPTMKPVELVARALTNSSIRGATVFEPFSGSGTTIIASEQTGRHCFAIELEPKYVQVAIERWEKFTGKTAVLG